MEPFASALNKYLHKTIQTHENVFLLQIKFGTNQVLHKYSCNIETEATGNTYYASLVKEYQAFNLLCFYPCQFFFLSVTTIDIIRISSSQTDDQKCLFLLIKCHF